jgi:hypothetical protein
MEIPASMEVKGYPQVLSLSFSLTHTQVLSLSQLFFRISFVGSALVAVVCHRRSQAFLKALQV